MEGKRRVAVVFGGRSAEHEISCISARSVIDALDPVHFDVVPIGITRDGRWRVLDGPPALPAETGRMPEVGDGDGHAVELAAHAAGHELVSEHGGREPIDIVFPVLHGPFGEDGAFQGFLDLAGVPYVGAGVLGSALGMDKIVQKALLTEAGLPVVPYVAVREHEWADDPEAVTGRILAMGFPVFVKPAALGSSVGISAVTDPTGALTEAITEALRYGRKAIVERALDHPREIEVAVLGNDDPVASVPGEVVPRGEGFYDYEAKYLDADGAELRVPAPIDESVADEIRRLAVLVFTTLEASGMARVDFFVDGDTVWVNEINTIPGFTPISMYPKLWAASGLAYPDLIARLLDLAVERHEAERAKDLRPRELGRDDRATGGRRDR